MSDPFGGERPTAEGVDTLYTHLRTVWDSVRAEMSELDTFKAGTFAVWKDPKRPAYHPPTARYLIDHAVDTQMSVDPKVKKFPAGKGKTHKDRADAVEPALTA